MADTNFRGPVNAMGALVTPAPAGSTTASANQVNTVVSQVEPLDGPSIFYQATGHPDIRDSSFNKDGFRPGQQDMFLHIPNIYAIDCFPQAAATNVIGAFQLMTAATPITLVATQPAGVAGAATVAVGVPIIPRGTTVVTTAALALDFGFATGTTTTNSSTVAVNDNTLFSLGQWIVIAGAGNAGASASLITQVVNIATANITGINISPVAVTGLLNVPIGAANLFGGAQLPPGTQFGPATASANAWAPQVQAGLGAAFNPKELSSRNISFSAGTTTSTTGLTITGWDVWGNLMTEKLVINSGNRLVSTFFASKAFKFVQSIAVQTTAGGSTAIGIGDVFGFPLRVDHASQYQAWWNNCAIGSTAVGFTAAATTAPTNNTAGDVRGTLQISSNGTGTAAPIANATVTNGTARLVIIQNPGVFNALANPNNPVPMFGVAQSTT